MSSLLDTLYYRSPAPLQNFYISAHQYARWPKDHGPRYRRWCRLVEESQWWSREALERRQLQRLQALVAHAYANVPAYRRLYDEAGVRPEHIQSLADIALLPMVTKRQMREAPQEFRAQNANGFHPIPLNTSGTTGTPFQFDSDAETEAVERAFVRRHRSWGGLRTGETVASMGGKLVVPLDQKHPPYWRSSHPDKILWLSTFHMTPDHLDLYVEHLRSSGIRFLKGYPSNLAVFAYHLKERGGFLPMKAVFTGSEPLFEHARATIEERFRCRVYDWYGVSERVVTSGQCERLEDYHVHMENCLVEIVRGDVVARVEEVGEIAGTCLSNYAMPFIRYRTGDMSARTEQPCGCGRGLMTIRQVTTKWEHVLTTADGRWISPSTLTHPFKPVQGLRKSQIIQDTPGEFIVKVVADASFDGAQEHLLLAGFHSRLGAGAVVRIDRVEDLPVEPSGKFRWIISRVPSRINDLVDLQQQESVGS